MLDFVFVKLFYDKKMAFWTLFVPIIFYYEC